MLVKKYSGLDMISAEIPNVQLDFSKTKKTYYRTIKIVCKYRIRQYNSHPAKLNSLTR